MSTDNKKTIMSLCPFQTQLASLIPVVGHKVIAGATPQPQIIKVQCDRDKCQLWNGSETVCAVSAIPLSLDVATDSTIDLTDAIRDIVEELKSIKSVLAPPLRTE